MNFSGAAPGLKPAASLRVRTRPANQPRKRPRRFLSFTNAALAARVCLAGRVNEKIHSGGDVAAIPTANRHTLTLKANPTTPTERTRTMTDQDPRQQDEGLLSDEANAASVLQEKLIDAMIPGFQVEFDPDEAEKAGAFKEDALSEADALDSGVDLADLD